jgi:hypothetical protein
MKRPAHRSGRQRTTCTSCTCTCTCTHSCPTDKHTLAQLPAPLHIWHHLACPIREDVGKHAAATDCIHHGEVMYMHIQLPHQKARTSLSTSVPPHSSQLVMPYQRRCASKPQRTLTRMTTFVPVAHASRPMSTCTLHNLWHHSCSTDQHTTAYHKGPPARAVAHVSTRCQAPPVLLHWRRCTPAHCCG